MEEPTTMPAEAVTSGAGFGIRFLARLIDTFLGLALGFVVGVVGAIVLAIMQSLGAVAPGWQDRMGNQGATGFCLSLFGSFLYQCCTEGVHGASLGKLICRLRVITTDGQPCNMLRAVQRTLLYYWDALFFGLVGYSSMQKTPLNQRYGDVWAKTVVVDAAAVPESARRTGWVFFVGFTMGTACWALMLMLGTFLAAR